MANRKHLLAAACAAVVAGGAAAARQTMASLLQVDQRALVSRADLVYRSPAADGTEGQPIGNGVMGTAVWTSPGALHFQINRCDVFAAGKAHAAGPQHGPTDYCGSCARVTVEVGGQPFAAGERFAQRLSLHEAEVSLRGEGLQARCFVSAVADVLVLEVNDQRPEPQALRVTLSRWRPAAVKTADHVATLEFGPEARTPVLTQRFHEGDYHCASAVAAQVAGRRTETDATAEEARTLRDPSGRGLIASCAFSVTRDRFA